MLKSGIVRYMEIIQEMNTAYNLIAQKYKLSYNALMVLYIIYEYENVTQKMICDKLFFSKSTVHSIVLDLQKKNYVQLVHGNNNKEKYIVFVEDNIEFILSIMNDTERFENKVMLNIGKEKFATYLKQTEEFSTEMIRQAKLVANKGV